ncbi:hypothetical protein D3C83_183330 [compost metagenome]
MKPEQATAQIMVIASSRNNRPVWPAMNITGTNTAQTTAVVEMIAKPTCRAPRKEATSGSSPSSIR